MVRGSLALGSLFRVVKEFKGALRNDRKICYQERPETTWKGKNLAFRKTSRAVCSRLRKHPTFREASTGFPTK